MAAILDNENRTDHGTFENGVEQIMAQLKREAIRSGGNAPLAAKAPAARLLPAMPLEIVHRGYEIDVRCERNSDDLVFNLFFDIQRQRAHPGVHFVNSYSERELFLNVRTPGEALEFLGVTGFFRYPEWETDFDSPNWRYKGLRDSIKWSEFKLWQQLIRSCMAQGGIETESIFGSGDFAYTELILPPDILPIFEHMRGREKRWLLKDSNEFFIGTRQTKSKPERIEFFASISVECSLEAMLATIYVDGLNGVNYGLCRLSDCSNLFEIISKHKREYCSQPCAHKASVRKRREELRKARDAAKATSASEEIR